MSCRGLGGTAVTPRDWSPLRLSVFDELLSSPHWWVSGDLCTRRYFNSFKFIIAKFIFKFEFARFP